VTLRQSNNPPNEKVETSESETGEEQSQEHAHNLFDNRGVFRKEFVLAGQRVNRAYCCNFYGDCIKMRSLSIPLHGTVLNKVHGELDTFTSICHDIIIAYILVALI
jgi:hypothetical protein